MTCHATRAAARSPGAERRARATCYAPCPMHPVLFKLGPLTFYSFGLMLAIAFIVCGELLRRELARRGMDGDLAGTVLSWAIVGSIVGAKLYYIIERWDEVGSHLLGSIFSGSGLVAYGGFAGGILASWFAIRRA